MYKVTLYDRGSYPNNGQVLLDTSSGGNSGVTESKLENKLNEAGSFTFSIVPSHPLYSTIEPLCTFVSVEEDGVETFYGRVLMVKTNRITGIKQITCEGALAFLLDAELGEDSEEDNTTPKNYFTTCIGMYNSSITASDAARRIRVGTVNVPAAMTAAKFKNGSRAQIQSVMKSKLLNVYDGFFFIRRSGTYHYLHWLTQVGVTDPQPIRIKQNVITHNTTESGEDVFTMLWPKGNSQSGGGSVEIEPIALSNAMVAKYGRIIRTVNFDADDETTLRTKAMEHIAKIQDRLSISGEINFVDMSYQDGTHPKVHIGDVFTNIDGFEGTKFTAATVSKDLLDPKNDKLSLKTDKDLMSSSGTNGTNSNSTGGVGSGSGGGRGLSGAGSKWYKFIHETETDLSLAAKNIEITAEEKIRLVSQTVETHAEQISTLSTDMGTVKGKWTEYEGTAIYQNREQIATVAGKFRTDNYGRLLLAQGTEFVVSSDGTSTNVGRLEYLDDNTVRDVGQIAAHYHGSYGYQHDDEIGEIVGRYTVTTYVDPQNPWKAITPASDANPKALGYYEYSGGQYVKTNDETVDPNKPYYIPNDIKKVTFDSGGGYRLKENGVEYGVYTKVGDSAELTGGMVVDMLNDGTTTTKIKGTRVIIGEDLTEDDLATWAAGAENGTGVFEKYLTVKRLSAQDISTLLANIGTATISSLDITNGIECQDIDCGQIDCTGINANTGSVTGGAFDCDSIEANGYDITNPIMSATVDQSTNTLTLTKADGTVAATFSKAAASSKVTGTWSNGTYTVSASENGQNLPLSMSIDGVLANGAVSATSGGLISVPVQVMAKTGTSASSATGYTQDFLITPSPVLEELTGSSKITANGTYTPSSGKIGFSSVVVDVAGGSGITGLTVDTTNHQVKTSTSATAQSVTISPGTMTKSYVSAQRHYAYVLPINAGSSVIASASGTIDASAAYNEGWDRGGATAWPRTTGSQVGTYVWHLPPGQYLVPGYSDHNGADKSRTDYSWYIPTAWLESSGSSGPSGASNQGVLAYDTCYFIRYKGPGGASTGDYVGAYWRTPPDNGGGGGSHNISIGTAWTTDRALSGWTRLNDLRNKYEAARSDSEYVAFEVSCGGTSKVYYMEP